MYAPERHRAILDTARSAGRVEVKNLARQLDVTPETIRRDLTLLERRGLLLRAHGGAIPVQRGSIEAPVAERNAVNVEAKEAIARAALGELPEGGSILLDAGTSTIRLAEMLPATLGLTVVTNSMPIAATLAGRDGIDLHVLGGHVRTATLAAVGPWTWDSLESLAVDVAFIGANGITTERGITTPDVDEARVKSAFVAAARRTVVLADHSKFGREDFSVVAPLSAIDAIITDQQVDGDFRTEIEGLGIDVVVAS
ncbi:MAG: DeoR/GlpR family DNA-binding transcription regulator [Microbacteriaceae bacterium]